MSVYVCLIYQGEGKKDVLKDMAVVVNGAKQSLDLVALICYYKLKKKFPGVWAVNVFQLWESCFVFPYIHDRL